MTNFTLNMEDTFDGGIQDGTYETVITKFEEVQHNQEQNS